MPKAVFAMIVLVALGACGNRGDLRASFGAAEVTQREATLALGAPLQMPPSFAMLPPPGGTNRAGPFPRAGR